VVEEELDLGLQVGEVAGDLDVVCVGTAGPERDQCGVVRLAPDERVRDEHGAAVEEVLAAAGPAAALGVGEEHVAAVLLHGEELGAEVIRVGPVEGVHAGPGLAARGVEQLAAQLGLRRDAAAPEELLLLVLEVDTADHFAVGVGDSVVVVVNCCDPPADLPVGSDVDLRPRPVPKVGHQPDGVVPVALRVRPDRALLAILPADGKVLRREDELDAGELVSVRDGRQRAVERAQGGLGAGEGDRHGFVVEDVELESRQSRIQ